MSTTNIAFQWIVSGVLTDVTSAVFQDPTNTYGIKRTDNDGVVVAAGTALTHQSTGVYAYSFTDPAPGLTYQYYVTVVYNGQTFQIPYTKTAPVSAYDVTLLQARTILQQAYIRSSGNSASDTARFNWAIEFACNEVLRRIRCNADIVTFPTVANTDTYSLTTVLSGLRAGYIMGARVDNQVLGLVDFNKLATLNNTPYSGYAPQSYLPGVPSKYAHEVPTTITLWPTPTAVKTVSIRYWSPLVPLASDSTVLNIPRHVLIPTLTYGATAALGFKDPDDNFESVAWRRFIDEIIPGLEASETTNPVIFSDPDDNE